MALDQFPVLIGQGFISEKTPIWETDIKTAASGRERRRMTQSYPRWRFRIAYDVLRLRSATDDLMGIWAFFNKQAGRYREWAYLDPSDNAVSEQAFGFGDGTTKVFQLVRTINASGFLFTEPVRAVQGTPTIKINGTPTVAWTLDDNGVVTFTSAPPNLAALTWTGTFMFHVRFDQDELPASQMMQQLWSQSGLTFISVKK